MLSEQRADRARPEELAGQSRTGTGVPMTRPMVIGAAAASESLETRINARAVTLTAGVAAVAIITTLLTAGRLASLAPATGLVTMGAAAGAGLCSTLLFARARVGGDARLRWMAWCYGTASMIMLLEVAGTGLFRSEAIVSGLTPSTSAWLGLLAQGAILVGALGAVIFPRASGWPRLAVTVGFMATAALVASERVAVPPLVDGLGRYTALHHQVLFVVSLVTLVALAVWERSVGRRASLPHAWVTVSLAFSLWSLLVLGFAGDRFGELWWASQVLELGQHGVLAAGLVGGLAKLVRVLDQHVAEIAEQNTLLAERERAIEEDRASLQLLITSGPVVMFRADRDLNVTYVSPNVAAALGYQPGDLTGGHMWADVVHMEDRTDANDRLRRAAEGIGSETTLRLRHADGTFRSTRMVVRPGPEREERAADPDDRARLLVSLLADSAVGSHLGEAAGPAFRDGSLLGYFIDVTDNVRLQDRLRHAKERADVANAAKSDFLSRMSHELRTPLTVILGYSELLEMDGVTEEQQESVEQIVKAGRHLLSLIEEVVDISRIEGGRLSLSIEQVGVSQAVDEVVALMRPMAAQRNVALTAGQGTTGCDTFVLADRQRLRQVLLNVLSNAIKYNRPGGKVALDCTTGENGRVRFEVSDTGRGIDEDKRWRLFRPFDRMGAEQTGEVGSGLGLALCKQLVEAMDGDIDVSSETGVGSTFWVELPTTHAPDGDAFPPPRPPVLSRIAPNPGAPGAVILYVEDNASNVQVAERILSYRPELTLLSVPQGERALELAVHHRPSLIFLDLHLPDIPGIEVLERLSGDLRTQDIPVVVVTADAAPAQVDHVLRAGARSALTKPIDITAFRNVVDQHCTAGPSAEHDGVGTDPTRFSPASVAADI